MQKSAKNATLNCSFYNIFLKLLNYQDKDQTQFFKFDSRRYIGIKSGFVLEDA